MRWLAAAAAAASVALFASPSAAALGTNYDHDSNTTYCWAIAQPTKVTALNETDRVDGFSGTLNCPIIMTATLSATQLEVFENLTITWTLTADFTQRNRVNMTRVTYGQDTNGNVAQIVHSNVHSCNFGSGCDPFSEGSGLFTKTSNKIANFSDNFVTFRDSIKFTTPGEFSVLAHVVLPDTNESWRYDFGVYSKLLVVPAKVTAPPKETEAPAPPVTQQANERNVNSKDGLSTAALVGIIAGVIVLVGALVALVVLLYRKRKRDVASPSQHYMAPPAYDTSMQLLAAGAYKDDNGNRPGLSDATDATTAGGFQSARSGLAVGPGSAAGRPSQNLDNTSGSNASGGSYASSYDRGSQVSGLNRSHVTTASSAAMHRKGSHAASTTSAVSSGNTTATRQRRVDSDVEL